MAHEDFLSTIYSRLSTIISSEPLFSHINCHPSKISLSKLNSFEQNPSILVTIRRFDQSLINVYVSQDDRVFQLKRAIQNTFIEKNIHWKSIWKRYILTTNDHQQLINDNRRIKSYEVFNNSELSFLRRRRLK